MAQVFIKPPKPLNTFINFTTYILYNFYKKIYKPMTPPISVNMIDPTTRSTYNI
ncbi:hypothetical protein Hanom_Chr04g00336891 [Helianthus anomalus]